MSLHLIGLLVFFWYCDEHQRQLTTGGCQRLLIVAQHLENIFKISIGSATAKFLFFHFFFFCFFWFVYVII